MDWDKIRIFQAAAEAGSFTHAGETLRMSQSAISRQVSTLEKDLGITLFHRHARGLVLTEQGETLYRTASDVLERLSSVENELADTTDRPQGELRLTAPLGLGTLWLTPRLPGFLELYPDISLELILSDEHIDIAMRAADVALWVGEPTQSDLIRRPMFTMSTHVYASASYIRRFGAPQSIDDLDQHRFVSYSGNPPEHLSGITFLETLISTGTLTGSGTRGAPDQGGGDHNRTRRRTPAFRASGVMAIREAVRAGIGIGILPDYLARNESDLVPVLPDLDLPSLPIFLVYSEEMRQSKRLAVLRDFLVRESKNWKY